MTSHVAISRIRSSRPVGLCRSSVSPFLFVLSPEKIGDFSHQCSSVIGMPAISRVPSGRRVDSTWMTSAPSMASMCVQDGPAQKVVMSRTRRPSSGAWRRRRRRRRRWRRRWRDGISAVVLGVFAEARRRLRCTKPRRLHPIRRPGLGKAVPRIRDERPARHEMVEGFDVGAVGDRGVGNPERRREIADLVDGLALDPGIQFAGLLVGLLGDRQRRLFVDPVLMAGHRAQVEPLLRGAAADVDQAVFGPRDAGHGKPARVAPWPAQHFVVGDRIVGEAEDLGLEHRQVDQLGRAPHPGYHRGRARVRACEIVADLPADEYRCPVG